MYKDEQEQIQKILSGEQEAFDALYNANFQKIYNYVYMQVREHAVTEDLTQEVFMAFFESLENFEGKSSLLCWIYSITKNIVHNWFRKKSRERCSLQSTENNYLENCSSHSSTPLSQIEYNELLLTCNSRFEQLAPENQDIFIKKHFKGLSIKEIAKETRKSQGSIKTTLYRTKTFILEDVCEHTI